MFFPYFLGKRIKRQILRQFDKRIHEKMGITSCFVERCPRVQ
jgi:hypothetical protein